MRGGAGLCKAELVAELSELFELFAFAAAMQEVVVLLPGLLQRLVAGPPAEPAVRCVAGHCANDTARFGQSIGRPPGAVASSVPLNLRLHPRALREGARRCGALLGRLGHVRCRALLWGPVRGRAWRCSPAAGKGGRRVPGLCFAIAFVVGPWVRGRHVGRWHARRCGLPCRIHVGGAGRCISALLALAEALPSGW